MQDIQVTPASPFKKSGATTIVQRQSGDSFYLLGEAGFAIGTATPSYPWHIKRTITGAGVVAVWQNLQSDSLTELATLNDNASAYNQFITFGSAYPGTRKGVTAAALNEFSTKSNLWMGTETAATFYLGTNSIPRASIDTLGTFKTMYGRVESNTTLAAATYSTLVSDHNIFVTYTATGAVTIDIPTAQLVAGRIFKIWDTGGNASANNITITTQGAETINGAASVVINANYASKELISDGTNWFAR